MVVNVLLLVMAFAVSVVGPGMVVCRGLKWNPLEKLCAGVGLSLLIAFLLGLGIYILKLPVGWHYLVAGVGVVGTVLSGKELMRLGRSREVRRAAVSYVVVVVVGWVMISLIRDLAGGEWFGDWVEHFQRTGFWLGKFPLDYKFIGDYPLPARPPMMNILCANLMAEACPPGRYPFAVYQLALLLLNSLIILPVGLIVRAVWRGGGRWAWLAVGLLLMNPMFIQNLTYPWTRHLTTFYVLTGIWFYLAGWRKGDWLRMTAGFVAVTAAMLVHYSAGPYLFFLVVHYLMGVWWRRAGRWRELGTIVATCAVVLGTWVGWAIATYGAAVTFGANSVITDSSRFSASGNVAKILGNTFRTLVPIFLRGTPETIQRQESRIGFVRDYFFVTYQQNAIFALGSAGAILTAILLWRKFTHLKRERLFWLCMIGFVGILGIAVNGTPDWYGYAHIVLQGMIYMGVCLVAAGVHSLSVPWRIFLLAGLTLDFWAGIFLHLSLEHWSNESVLALSPAAISNFEMKVRGGMILLGDRVPEMGLVLQTALVLGWIAGMVWIARRLLRDHKRPMAIS